MIYPNLGPTYYDEKDRGVLSHMETFYLEAITTMQAYWALADTNNRFYAGDQNVWTDIYGGVVPINRRRQFTFNRIRRTVNMIDGHQRRNRKSIIAVPMENGDAKTADQFTKALMWIYDTENVGHTFSDAFKGGLISGMNLLQLWMDYRNDPINGDIKVDNCAYNSFLIDPFFRKADLSDCRAIWKRNYLSKKQCLSLLPDKEDDILGMMGSPSNRDGKFQFMPEQSNFSFKNLLTYDEYYYADFRTQKMLVDTQTGETMEWRKDDNELLNRYLSQYPTVTLIEQEIPTVRMAIVVQGKVMYDGPQSSGLDSYPFVPVYCYYNPQLPYYDRRIQGIVSDLIDPQYLYNRRKIIELDILESQVNSGYIYKENALVNPADVFNLAGQGKGIAIKEEAQITDVIQIQAPQIPPTMMAISELLGKEISEVSGVNDELLGTQSDSLSGFQSALRQGAGLTTLQGVFDQADLSLALLGRRQLELMQLNWTPGKMKQILEGEEPTPEFYNKNFGKYNCAIEEGLNTTTQKQMMFAQMLELRQAGVPIPDSELLEACTLQNKTRIIEKMEQEKQQAMQMQQMQLELQQQQAQMAMQEQQARIQLAQARAVADEGLGAERYSRIEENKALALERRAEARKDDDQALLNLVKALKEIESVDLANLEKLLALSRMSSGQSQQSMQQYV